MQRNFPKRFLLCAFYLLQNNYCVWAKVWSKAKVRRFYGTTKLLQKLFTLLIYGTSCSRLKHSCDANDKVNEQYPYAVVFVRHWGASFHTQLGMKSMTCVQKVYNMYIMFPKQHEIKYVSTTTYIFLTIKNIFKRSCYFSECASTSFTLPESMSIFVAHY